MFFFKSPFHWRTNRFEASTAVPISGEEDASKTQDSALGFEKEEKMARMRDNKKKECNQHWWHCSGSLLDWIGM